RMGSHVERVPVYDEWKKTAGDKKLPDYFVTAMDLSPEDHVKVQAAIQKWVDSSISKTSNTPNHYSVAQTKDLYQLMYDTGCKGGTTYRKHTPIGTAYITVNAGKGAIEEPFEVFINVAKVGSVIGQLRSIGSGRHHGFGKNRVMSLPDAVAQVLEEHIGKTNSME
ncbi:MAG: ribonucleoside-diphosphate reductase, adenosylcobalamin-dependent, partial [Spirochaetales bacterium]|nr:ribonucleoside-diphosphate reductase, adenosylcobalamin-dependent [Spirochaetales bacterium]